MSGGNGISVEAATKILNLAVNNHLQEFPIEERPFVRKAGLMFLIAHPIDFQNPDEFTSAIATVFKVLKKEFDASRERDFLR